MLSRFVLSQTARLLREPGALLACLALVLASVGAYVGGSTGACSGGERPGAYGAFVCYVPGQFVFLLPALAAVAGGMLVASSRARGEDVMYAVRGLAGSRLAVGRLLAGSAAAALLVIVAGFVLIALALLFLPHRPELEIQPGVTLIPGFDRPEAGVPSPGLWRSAPLAGDVLAVFVYALAAAALAAVGNAVGQFVAQPLLSFAAPVMLVLATQATPLPGAAKWLSGYVYLYFEPVHSTLTQIAGDWRLPALLGYWTLLLALSFALAVVAARRQATTA